MKEEGCSLVFSEFISLDEEIKPQLNKAINSLSKGDQLIITQLDRAFKNKKECLRTINKLINKDVKLRTLTGFFASNESTKANSSIFQILYELDNLEDKSLSERKKEQLLRRKLSGNSKRQQDCNEEGKVVVKIWVNRSGNVVKAERSQGTTNTNPCLVNPALETAKSFKWQPDANAPETQIGFVVVNFTLGQ